MIDNELYKISDAENISIVFFNLPKTASISVKHCDNYYIAIDPLEVKTTAQWNEHLAHELGHCVTDSFYNVYSKLDLRARHEYRADKWAIKKLIPKDKLEEAIKNGNTEVWQLAEYFDVTENFVKKALHIYYELQPMKR